MDISSKNWRVHDMSEQNPTGVKIFRPVTQCLEHLEIFTVLSGWYC